MEVVGKALDKAELPKIQGLGSLKGVLLPLQRPGSVLSHDRFLPARRILLMN